MSKSKIAVALLVAASTVVSAGNFGMNGQNIQNKSKSFSRGEHVKPMQGQGCDSKRAGMHTGMMADLNLSAEQQTQLDTIKTAFDEKIKTIMPTSRDGLSQYSQNGYFDKQGFITAHTTLSAQMVQARADFMEQVYNILTFDQKEKLKTLSTQQ